jgi:hypothetical protein
MFAAFLHSVVGQADHIEVLITSRAKVDLNFHDIGVDSVYGRAERRSVLILVKKAKWNINQYATRS